MGFEDRDYYKDEETGSGLFRGTNSSTTWFRLIIANCAMFLLQVFLPDASWGSLPERWFALVPESVLHGQVWRVVTYSFLHEGPWHLLINMVVLWFVGREIERIYGALEFLWIYLSAAVFAGVGFLLFTLMTGGQGIVIGASGATMALFMIFVMHYPRERFNFWGIFPIEARWLLAFFVFLDLVPLLQSMNGGRSMDQVAHAAHLAGLGYGYLYKRTGWTIATPFRGLSWLRVKRVLRRSPKLKVFSGEEQSDEQMKEEVDRLLAKISAQGEASLTEKERKFLMQASRRFRQR